MEWGEDEVKRPDKVVIFTNKLTLRQLDWPDWSMLTHAKKRNLVGNASGDTGTNSGREAVNV